MAAPDDFHIPFEPESGRRVLHFPKAESETVEITLTPELRTHLMDVMVQADITSIEDAAAAVLLTRARQRAAKLTWTDALGWANRFPEDPHARFRTEADL